MSHRGLSTQIEQIRAQVENLKNSLDQTVQSLEDVSSRTTDLAQEARQMVDVLGETRAGGKFPWGLFLTLALGAGAVWLISPETITSVRDFLTAQVQRTVGGMEERHRPMP